MCMFDEKRKRVDRAHAVWREAHPFACVTCDGHGWLEGAHPFGGDLCPDCIARGFCPRCFHKLARGHGGMCGACGANFATGDDACPHPIECHCPECEPFDAIFVSRL